MKFLSNRKLATRISSITTLITFAGMLLLWFTVSSRVASMVENNITNQMIDAVESRAAIINDYVASAEEYMTAFALSSKFTNFWPPRKIPSFYKKGRNTQKILQQSKVFLKGSISQPPLPMFSHIPLRTPLASPREKAIR